MSRFLCESFITSLDAYVCCTAPIERECVWDCEQRFARQHATGGGYIRLKTEQNPVQSNSVKWCVNEEKRYLFFCCCFFLLPPFSL